MIVVHQVLFPLPFSLEHHCIAPDSIQLYRLILLNYLRCILLYCFGFDFNLWIKENADFMFIFVFFWLLLYINVCVYVWNKIWVKIFMWKNSMWDRAEACPLFIFFKKRILKISILVIWSNAITSPSMLCLKQVVHDTILPMEKQSLTAAILIDCTTIFHQLNECWFLLLILPQNLILFR